MNRAPASDPVFRLAAIVCVVAGLVGTGGVLWVLGLFDANVNTDLPPSLLILIAVILCTPVMHLVGGVLMLARGSVAAATVTTVVTTGGTILVGPVAVLTLHPLAVAPAVTGLVVIGLLIWSVVRAAPDSRSPGGSPGEPA